MNVNPEDYDPEELRRMAEERRVGERPEAQGQSRDGDDPAPRRNRDGGGPRRNGTDGRYEKGWSFGDERSHRRPERGNPTDSRAASGRPRGNPEPVRGPASDALRSNHLEQLFLHQSAMIAEEMTKPYLGDIPQKFAAERVVFDWLEFLVLKGGFKRTMDALRYYRTIGWITADVESALGDYLIGFSDDGAGAHDLDVDDHQLSLVYVARLASMS
jgi:archaellum component FlaD/FlaE